MLETKDSDRANRPQGVSIMDKNVMDCYSFVFVHHSLTLIAFVNNFGFCDMCVSDSISAAWECITFLRDLHISWGAYCTMK